jgi:glycosyltransferase involved in cell wall biosynthesis
MAPSNVVFHHDIPDAQLRWLYSSAAALFAVGLEDFGLTPIEAASFGLPTLARPFGGYLDTVIDGVNGVFLEGLEPHDFAGGISRLRSDSPDVAAIRESAERFSSDEFASRMTAVVEQVRSAS